MKEQQEQLRLAALGVDLYVTRVFSRYIYTENKLEMKVSTNELGALSTKTAKRISNSKNCKDIVQYL